MRNLGEVSLSRRTFLSAAVTLGRTAAAAAGASLLLEACGQKPSPSPTRAVEATPSPFSLDTDIVYPGNLKTAAKEIWHKSRDFDAHILNILEPVTDDNPASTIPSVLPEDVLRSRGMKAIAIGNLVQQKSTIVYFACDEDIRYGTRFSELPTPYPGFMLLDDNTTMLPIRYGETFYMPEGTGKNWTIAKSLARGDRIEDVSITFPISERDLAGHEFVIHLNAQLLRPQSGNRDFDSFTIPRRFILRRSSTT